MIRIVKMPTWEEVVSGLEAEGLSPEEAFRDTSVDEVKELCGRELEMLEGPISKVGKDWFLVLDKGTFKDLRISNELLEFRKDEE